MSVEPMEPFFKEIKEKQQLSMTGNYAAAGGVSQTDPDVICAFPITPQTQGVEGLADVVNHGAIKSAFVNVESELAACSFSTRACAAGRELSPPQLTRLFNDDRMYADGCRMAITFNNACFGPSLQFP